VEPVLPGAVGSGVPVPPVAGEVLGHRLVGVEAGKVPDVVAKSHDRLCTVGRTIETGTPIATRIE
jgi:hypothetical protein